MISSFSTCIYPLFFYFYCRTNKTLFQDVHQAHLRFFKKAASGSKRAPSVGSRAAKKKIVDVSFDKGQLEHFNVVYEDVPKKLPFTKLGRPFVFATVVSFVDLTRCMGLVNAL